MNYNHLYYFYQVIKSGGVASASRRLGISQASLSTQMKVFEEACGGELYTKNRGVLNLSERGQLVFKAALNMFGASEELERRLESEDFSPAQESLRIGVCDDIDRPFIMGILKLFYSLSQTKPRTRVYVVSGSAQEIVAMLRRGDLDVALTDVPNRSEDLSELGKFPMPVAVIFKQHSKYFLESERTEVVRGKGYPALRKLLTSGWAALASSTRFRRETDRFIEKIGVVETPLIESSIVAIVKQSVVDDVVSSILPIPYVLREIQKQTVRFAGPRKGFWSHEIQLLGRQQSVSVSSLDRVRRAFEGYVKQMNRETDDLY
ncbi:MAG: LysR family transcriptional regulator [Bdellovibrionales bacterium]|nr:LysR family transcriptional regulator [Bdellovibrionales bacterium]